MTGAGTQKGPAGGTCGAFFMSRCAKDGEPDRIRTCDPLIKSQLLYLLSYGPPLKHTVTVGVT